MFIALVPTILFFKNFPIGLLNNFWDFREFHSWSGVFKRFNHYFSSREGVILCKITGDVQQIIGHCLIPLFGWYHSLSSLQTNYVL